MLNYSPQRSALNFCCEGRKWIFWKGRQIKYDCLKRSGAFASFLKTQKRKLRKEHICVAWERVTVPWVAHFFLDLHAEGQPETCWDQGGSSNLDRTSVGKPCDWPRGTSQTVIPSTVLEPNAEANKICSSYAWETSQAQLPHLPPAFAFFCQVNAQRGKGRGEGWSDSHHCILCVIFLFAFGKA